MSEIAPAGPIMPPCATCEGEGFDWWSSPGFNDGPCPCCKGGDDWQAVFPPIDRRQPAPKIITKFDYPPIPDRRFDWSAVTEDYDLGSPIGHGATKKEAEADLLEQLEERS